MRFNCLLWAAIALALGSPTQVVAQKPTSPGHPQLAFLQDRDHDHDWNVPPDEFRDAKRRGFEDGIQAGHRDFEAHREPAVEQRPEFRHPRVSREVRDEYREGFRHGYERAFSHFRDDHDHDRDHQ